MKKILVISGSPRQNGNSDLLARAFMEGAAEAGGEVFLFEAGKKRMAGCLACDACFSSGGRACPASSAGDGFDELAPLLEQAEVLALCTPLYWFTFPSQMKAAIDKLYAFSTGGRPLKIREALLLVCAETDDPRDFDGIIKTYELIVSYQQWKNRGILTVPGVNKPGDIQKAPGALALKKARALGEGIGA